MLSPDLALTIQFLKNLSATVIPKQLTPKGRHRGKGGSLISSSLLRHDDRIRTKTQNRTNKKERKTKGRLQVSTKNNRTKIYMMHEQFKCHDACSNAVRLSSIEVQIHKIGLSIEFLTKTPQNFEKPLEKFGIN